MKRRNLLAGGAGLLGLAGLGALSAIQPRRGRWPSLGTGGRARVAEARRVVIVGGGLAGIACAAALAQRGYRVTLLERGSALGGKLGGWSVVVGGAEAPMEHGFHGFFRQYYNLRALLAEAGADRDLVPQDAYEVRVRGREPESFGAGWAPFPASLVAVLARSSALSLGDVAGDRPGMAALLSYDPVETFRRWDGVDAATFVTEGRLAGPFADVVLAPFGQASMNDLAHFSAAELIRFFHFYMLGNPEGLGFDALGRGVHLSVLAPLRALLERLGVEVRTGAPVAEVTHAQGRVTGVVLEGTRGPTIEESALPATGWTTVAEGAWFARRARGGGVELRDARCTHLGCRVSLAADGFRCPCHAGRYDLDGVPISGPPPAPLRGPGATSGEEVAADVVVVATESGAFRALVDRSGLGRVDPALEVASRRGGEADPYAVVRFWFDRPVLALRPAFATVAGWTWTDSLALYSAFQSPYTRSAHAVVESHAYAIPAALQGPVEVYRDALLDELRQIWPELADARVVHEEAMTQSNFTRFAPGDAATRPRVTTALPNLFVAGDHVHLPFPAFLMEAAVASGRLAANHVCAADGVVETPIETVALRGPLAGLV